MRLRRRRSLDGWNSQNGGRRVKSTAPVAARASSSSSTPPPPPRPLDHRSFAPIFTRYRKHHDCQTGAGEWSARRASTNRWTTQRLNLFPTPPLSCPLLLRRVFACHLCQTNGRGRRSATLIAVRTSALRNGRSSGRGSQSSLGTNVTKVQMCFSSNTAMMEATEKLMLILKTRDKPVLHLCTR